MSPSVSRMTQLSSGWKAAHTPKVQLLEQRRRRDQAFHNRTPAFSHLSVPEPEAVAKTGLPSKKAELRRWDLPSPAFPATETTRRRAEVRSQPSLGVKEAFAIGGILLKVSTKLFLTVSSELKIVSSKKVTNHLKNDSFNKVTKIDDTT